MKNKHSPELKITADGTFTNEKSPTNGKNTNNNNMNITGEEKTFNDMSTTNDKNNTDDKGVTSRTKYHKYVERPLSNVPLTCINWLAVTIHTTLSFYHMTTFVCAFLLA